MRRNRKNNLKKERVVMLVSSVLVLTALTLTGIYMQAGEEKEKDNGYTLDFTAIDDTKKKIGEIAQNQGILDPGDTKADEYREFARTDDGYEIEDDLDYMPMEAGSGEVKISGLTKGMQDTLTQNEEDLTRQAKSEAVPHSDSAIVQETDKIPGEDAVAIEEAEISSQNVIVADEVHFDVANGLLRPLEGEVLIPFSMNGSVYFSTLDQYKYNPAVMLVANEGMSVISCAEGRVVSIYEDAFIGHALTVDIGDGYLLTYGQLTDINVCQGEYVGAGDVLGTVAAPTKYYSKEGTNLYLQLTLNGTPIDPESLFR